MKIETLGLTGFRNIEEMRLQPCDGVNVLYGDNAQGKTNVIEALWLLTGARSFRGARDSDLVRIGSQRSFIEAGYFAEGRSQSIKLDLAPKKQATRNEILLGSPGKLSGALYAVVFSPVHLSLIKDGPAERRDFLDTTICQLKPQYNRVLADYQRVLTQRGALLRDIPHSAYLQDTLEVWDGHLVRLTALIMKTRYTYLKKLAAHASETYRGISRGSETLAITYLPKAEVDPDSDNLQELVANSIRQSREEDIRTGVTNVGAHRDDVLIEIDGLSARSHGSQGQQRSVVLSLKLAECAVILETSGEQPVVLLDDVMSELDAARRDFLLNNLSDRQIFITCCEEELFSGTLQGKSFHLSGGKLVGETALGPEPIRNSI